MRSRRRRLWTNRSPAGQRGTLGRGRPLRRRNPLSAPGCLPGAEGLTPLRISPGGATERLRGRNGIAVAVGGDGADGRQPAIALASVHRFRSEVSCPSGVGLDGFLRERTRPALDKFLPLVECLTMFVVHGSNGLGDEACDELRRTELPTATAGAGGSFDPVAEDGGNVVRIVERLRGDDPRQKSFEVRGGTPQPDERQLSADQTRSTRRPRRTAPG